MTQPDRDPASGSRALEGAASPLELRNFRWAYSLLVALAIRILEEMKTTTEPGEWPSDMDWDDLADSSRAVFLKKAREEAGIIDHDEFLAYIRAGMGDKVADIYYRDATAPGDVGAVLDAGNEGG